MQTKQTKNSSPSTAPKPAEPAQKAAINAAAVTRVPAWANGWGNLPAPGLQLPEAQAMPAMPGIQTKLAVSQPGDPDEQEADRVAEAVMRMPASVPSQQQIPLSHQANVQRKCACGGVGELDGECEACAAKRKTLQRRATQQTANATVADATVPSVVNSVLTSGGGQPLNTSTQDMMEPRFGQDFSAVRVHTGEQAAESAQAINALAYTVGSDVVFGAGQYQPETHEGQKLLAHELTHVVQQEGHGNARREINKSVTINTASQGILQRFGSEEHVRIGEMALPGQDVLIVGYGKVPYGEMIAMAADYFGLSGDPLIEMRALMESRGDFGHKQIDFVRWKVNPQGRPKPNVDSDVEAAVMDRYYRLAARNETHFSTGSAPGQSNREQYIDAHTKAIRAAYSEGLMPLVIGRGWKAQEAVSAHFLSDAFAGGHIRTPRGQIQSYWNGLYPNFQADLVRIISCYMASYLKDRDNIGYVATVDMLADGVADVVRSKAGAALSAYSIGDLISKVMHDADNAGLDVVSPRGPAGTTTGSPFHWRAVGDSFLFPAAGTSATQAQVTTQQMVTEAVRLSFEEASQAFSAGVSPLTAHATLAEMTDPANFRALHLIPAEDTTSTTNPVYTWKVANLRALPANIQALLVAAFAPGAEIRGGLDSSILTPPPITPKTVLGITFDLHTGEAWDCFRGMLLANPFGAIVRIGDGDVCPPGKNNPCPLPTAPAPAQGSTAAPAQGPTVPAPVLPVTAFSAGGGLGGIMERDRQRIFKGE